MEGKTDRWDRMMHGWVMEGEESWGRRTRRRNGGREGRGRYGGAEEAGRLSRGGEGRGTVGRRGRWWGERMMQRLTSPGREKGCRTQGHPAGLPAAPQEAERPQRPLWNPPRLSTITTGAPTFHTHTRVRAHTCPGCISRAPSPPLTPSSAPPAHSPRLTSKQDSSLTAPGAGRTRLKLLSQPVAF